MITASDILNERHQARQAGVLAHTANVSGDFMARLDCSCYNCRDIWDPTGEMDAAERNTRKNTLVAEELPPLERQDTIGVASTATIPSIPPLDLTRLMSRTSTGSECHNTPHPPPPHPDHQPVCCKKSPAADPEPFTGLLNTNIYETPSRPEEEYKNIEKLILPYLQHLRNTYTLVQTHILDESENIHLKMDEQAALDSWWDEIEKKLQAVQTTMSLLEG